VKFIDTISANILYFCKPTKANHPEFSLQSEFHSLRNRDALLAVTHT